MLKQQSNFLVVSLLIFAFIFMCYAVLPYLKKPLPTIAGIVVKGTGQTSQYGYPTANMKINKKLEPGIYSGKCPYGKVTIYSEDDFKVKCHIHKFNTDILGDELIIRKVKFKESYPVNSY
jgi:FAD synthase